MTGVVAVTLAAALLVVVLLAHRGPSAVDDSVTPTLHAWAHADPARWRVFRAVTHLGEKVFTTSVYLLLVVVALVRRNTVTAVWVALSAATYPVLSTLIKVLVNRPRPASADPALTFQETSFPSGHSGASMLVALTVVCVVAMSARGWRRVLVMGVAFAIPAAVGLSRMALGVHYPSDVLAGFSLAITWAALTSYAVGRVAARRADGAVGTTVDVDGDASADPLAEVRSGRPSDPPRPASDR